MTLLAKLYAWPAVDNFIRDTEWTAEFNQILNLTNGGTSNRRGYTVFSDGSLPVWRYNQTGAGPVIEFQVGGTTKVSVNNSGQIVSAVATGTAPITVSSTTVCTNLNADTVDGITASQLVRSDATGEDVLGDIQITKASTGTQSLIIAVDNDIATFKRSSDGATIFTITGLNSATRVLNLPSTLNVTSAFTPVGSTDVLRKGDLAQYEQFISQYVSAPSTSPKYGGWICPASSIWKITEIKAFYQSGAPGSTTTIGVYQNGSSKGTLDLLSGATADTTYSNAITPFNVAGDDVIHFQITADGGHDQLTLGCVLELQ